MSESITTYRELKKNFASAAKQAKTEMESRYTTLLTEAAQLQAEYKDDFGSTPPLPAIVKTFTVNADAKITKKRKNAAPAEDNGVSGKKIAGLQRRANTLGSKIAVAKAQGKSTQKLEDDLYQVTDELRLAGAPVPAEPAPASDAAPAEFAAAAAIPANSLQAPPSAPQPF